MIEVSKDILVLIVIGIGVFALALGVWVVFLENRISKLTKGKDGSSLEQTIHDLIQAIEIMHDDQEKAVAERELLTKKLESSVRGIGIVRFNPFKDSGGNQSFAITLLDEKGNGAVISTLFSRERMSVFGKPITQFTSDYDLTKEESKSVEQARNQL